MKLLKILGIFILLILILFLFSKFYLPHFLSYSKPVDSKNFLIEAWISSYEIEQAIADYGILPESHFYIVGFLYPKLEVKQTGNNQPFTSSEKKENKGIWLYANSALNFLLPPNLNLNSGDTIQFTVTAKGQKSANYYAYFNLIINGECIVGAFSHEDYQQYSIDWIVPEEGLKTCYIKFNNDLVVHNSDRNLNIQSVKIDNNLFTADIENTTITRELNNLTSGFSSQAEEVGNYLQQLGIDQKQITTVNFEPVQSNQTLAAAEKFNKYLSESPLSAINVITSDIHSRRTWLTYQRVFGTQTNVGVLYYPSSRKEKSQKNKDNFELYYIIDEYLAYFVNYFLLSF